MTDLIHGLARQVEAPVELEDPSGDVYYTVRQEPDSEVTTVHLLNTDWTEARSRRGCRLRLGGEWLPLTVEEGRLSTVLSTPGLTVLVADPRLHVEPSRGGGGLEPGPARVRPGGDPSPPRRRPGDCPRRVPRRAARPGGGRAVVGGTAGVRPVERGAAHGLRGVTMEEGSAPDRRDEPAAGARAGADARPLPGTAPLTLQGDLAAQMVAGIDRFLARQLQAVVDRRPGSVEPRRGERRGLRNLGRGQAEAPAQDHRARGRARRGRDAACGNPPATGPGRGRRGVPGRASTLERVPGDRGRRSPAGAVGAGRGQRRGAAGL